MMINRQEILKALGLIGGAIWLLCLGSILCLFAMLNVDYASEPWQAQWIYGAAYVLLGLGPVWGLTILLKKYDNPIGARGLTVLAIFAASPLWFFLLITLP